MDVTAGAMLCNHIIQRDGVCHNFHSNVKYLEDYSRL